MKLQRNKFRILCVIYGIGRGIDVSSASIVQSLISPLRALGHEMDVLYVLNELAYLDNPRSGESAALAPVGDNIFAGEEIIRKNKKDLLNRRIFNQVKAVRDVHQDNYRTYENLICQLGMLHEATKQRDFFAYDRILLIRDDVILDAKRVDFSLLLRLSESSMVTTLWHWHGGISDRFALCSPNIGLLLATRLAKVAEFIGSKGYLNGEHLVKFVLSGAAVRVFACDIRLHRVRLYGIVKENFFLPCWRPLEFFRVLYAALRFKIAAIRYKSGDNI